MGHFNLDDLKHNQPIPEKSSTVIVGAGMSGLYIAWRLLRENPNQDVIILERSNRTGGRLDSDLVNFKGGATVKEEEGGMRFTFDNMDDLMSLFLLLDLTDQIVPFPMNSGGNNRLYFRGNAFTNADVAYDFDIWDELYTLDPAEQGINPKTIINTVFNRILDANPKFTERPENRTPEFWQKFRWECKWNGVRLIDWSLWNLLSEMGYSIECINLLYRLLGFNGTFLSQMNAGTAYQLLEDFPSEPDFKTLRDGFSTLPNALVDQIGKERIFLKTNMDSVSQNKNGYSLEYTTVDKEGNSVKGKVNADKVILCLPRLALEKVFVRSNAFNVLKDEQSKILWNNLQTTTNQPLMKINLYYDKAWWGNRISGQPPVEFGPNFSDLPLGSVYPFYSIDEETFAALEYEKWLEKRGKAVPDYLQDKLDAIRRKKYGLPAALTIYCDYMNINFWKALQHNGPLFTSKMQKKFSKKKPQTLYAASEGVVREATKFFKQLFNTHYVPEPVLTSARIWDGTVEVGAPESEQFGYGVHQWGLGANDKKVMKELVEPFDNLYTCGESFSDYQGWVEGALRSADLVLDKAFKLKPISEVYEKQSGISPSEAISAKFDAESEKLIKKYINPRFDPNASSRGVETEKAAPKLSYGLKLSYFDQQFGKSTMEEDQE